MPRLTPGPPFAADITPPRGSSPSLGVPSRSQCPAVTEGDASSPFILRQTLGTNTESRRLSRTTYPETERRATMTEESRGKRRKQANPKRNRGKKRSTLQSLKKLVNDAVRCGCALSCVHAFVSAVDRPHFKRWILFASTTFIFQTGLFCV